MAEIPQLRVQRDFIEGTGRITYTFSPDLLKFLLDDAGLQNVDGLDDKILRDLCRRASAAELASQIDRVAQSSTGAAAVIDHRALPGAVLDSRQLGMDIAKRLLPPPDDTIELRFDPQYSPVEVMLRVYDTAAESSEGRALPIGRLLLHATLLPPDLVQ